ncbi:MAG: PRC-barrel domain-containing protein [Kofleriaceae bacterium]|nr:PRC-barrel domain-containing protein [Kofleriaceae bacterium]
MPFEPHRADEIHAHRPRRPTPHKWELDHNSEDLRGWEVVDRTGARIGVVTRMYVDTETGNVVDVEIAGGRTFSAHDLLLGDHFLTLTTVPAPNAQPVVIAAAPPPAEPEPVARPAPPVLRSVPPSGEPHSKSPAQAARDERDDLIDQLLDRTGR